MADRDGVRMRKKIVIFLYSIIMLIAWAVLMSILNGCVDDMVKKIECHDMAALRLESDQKAGIQAGVDIGYVLYRGRAVCHATEWHIINGKKVYWDDLKGWSWIDKQKTVFEVNDLKNNNCSR